MSLLSHLATLLIVNPAVNTDQTGTPFRIIPEEDDGEFRAFLDITQAGGTTSPTVSGVVETSHDGTTWVQVASLGLSADGANSDLKTIAALGPIVRARTTLGGAAKPNHTATVRLASDKPFRLL